MKYFSREEAEQALPEIEKILGTALELKEKTESRMGALTVLERTPNTPADKIALERAQVEFLAQNIQSLLERIQGFGAVVKGLDPVLIDFPHRLNGKEVYLCWMLGEKKIEHYHGIEDGFSGRKPLPETVLPQ
ncbi:MAG: DUF2203 domain-containing protein [Elusimicrobia bacterium]|nr:DUF2203 domain-containing protein [Elusimicrobiota bacterium]